MSNCARLYNIALVRHASPPIGFPFKFGLSGDHVWSGVTQLSLIEDMELRDRALVVKHSGEHRDCFMPAIQEWNLRIHLYGQEKLCHYCSQCTILYTTADNILEKKYSVIVTDGVTVGHLCCAIHNCHFPLANNHDRFCPQHYGLIQVCAIVGCTRPVVFESKTCDDPTHQAVEKTYTECGQARFELQKHLERSRISNLADSFESDGAAAGELMEEEFDVDIDSDVDADSDRGTAKKNLPVPTTKKKTLHVQFG